MMQIANVDVRRFQNLNDSINRTIDALNQVRLSVYANETQNAFGFAPAIGGLAHAAAQNAFVNSMLANQFVSPFATAAFANAFTNPFANPYATLGTATGLGHTAFNAAYADPYNAARIAATLPVTQWGYSPYAWTTI
jgi:hypothetical protein